MKKLFYIGLPLTILAILSFVVTNVHAQVTNPLPGFISTSSPTVGITQRIVNANVVITGLTTGSTLCLSAAHVLTTVGCAGGGGGGTISTSSPLTAGLLIKSTGPSTIANIATSTLGLLTTDVAEGTNLYWTNTRFDNRLSATTTLPNITTLAGLSLPIAQVTGFNNSFDVRLTATTTLPNITTLASLGTVKTSLSGILKASSGVLAAAAAGTDYAPATSGSSLLFGNGSGGFSNASVGTGLSFTGGTLSATGGGGTGLGTTTPIAGGNVLTYSAAGAGAAYGTATSTHAFSGPFTISGILGALVGGSNSTVTWSGLSTTTSLTSGNLLYNTTNGNGVSSVATTTLQGSGAVSVTAGAVVLGGSAITVSCSTCLTANQTITLSGDVSGSGTTAITTAIGSNKVTLGDIAQIGANTVLVNQTGATGNVTALATSTLGTTLYGVGTNGFTLAEVNGVPTWTATTTLANISGTLSLTTQAAGTLQAAQFPALTGDITTTAGSLATALKSTGTAGTYRSTTFDAQGRETSGTNPTTFSGYGISDSSANLAAALTDETGSGSAVFSIAPAFTGLATFVNSTTTLASFTYASSTKAFFGTATIPSLGIPAGQFAAFDPNGVLIGTTSPSGGGGTTVTTLTATSSVSGTNLYENNISVVAGDHIDVWAKAQKLGTTQLGTSCSNSSGLFGSLVLKQSSKAASSTLDNGGAATGASGPACSSSLLGTVMATTTETMNIEYADTLGYDSATLIVVKTH